MLAKPSDIKFFATLSSLEFYPTPTLTPYHPF
jgi:hypothetical protein